MYRVYIEYILSLLLNIFFTDIYKEANGDKRGTPIGLKHIYTSSLYDELEVLIVINTRNRGIIAVADKRKNIKKRNVSIKGGDVTGKRNNKKGEKPFINCNN